MELFHKVLYLWQLLPTAGNGQDAAVFTDFRKQLLPHSKQNKKNQNNKTLSSFADKFIRKTATKRQQYEVEYIQD